MNRTPYLRGAAVRRKYYERKEVETKTEIARW